MYCSYIKQRANLVQMEPSKLYYHFKKKPHKTQQTNQPKKTKTNHNSTKPQMTTTKIEQNTKLHNCS